MRRAVIGRRVSGLVLALILAMNAALLASLSAPDSALAARPLEAFEQCVDGVRILGFSDALNKTTFAGTNVGGLSALAYNSDSNTYYSLVDNEATTDARFYELAIPIDETGLGTPMIGDLTNLTDAQGQPYTGANFDGEGLVINRDGSLFVSSETEPSIRHVSQDGTLIEALPVPQQFLVTPAGDAQFNLTFESLATTWSNSRLYTATEAPLLSDGSTPDGRGRIRLLTYRAERRQGFMPAEQYLYLTEPGQSVVEIVAVGEQRLLVLERGFVPGFGNTVRIFLVNVRGADDVSGIASLVEANVAPVSKELLVDIGASCPSLGAQSPGTQQNELLDNFESLALGPKLPGGYQALVLVSDDNFGQFQVTRIVALAVTQRALR